MKKRKNRQLMEMLLKMGKHNGKREEEELGVIRWGVLFVGVFVL